MMKLTQRCLFDAFEGARLRDIGMRQAATSRKQELARARDVAEQIAMSNKNRECNADQVQAVMLANKIYLGNAAGSIFKQHDKWEFVRHIKSSRISNRRAIIKVWRLK